MLHLRHTIYAMFALLFLEATALAPAVAALPPNVSMRDGACERLAERRAERLADDSADPAPDGGALPGRPGLRRAWRDYNADLDADQDNNGAGTVVIEQTAPQGTDDSDD